MLIVIVVKVLFYFLACKDTNNGECNDFNASDKDFFRFIFITHNIIDLKVLCPFVIIPIV